VQRELTDIVKRSGGTLRSFLRGKAKAVFKDLADIVITAEEDPRALMDFQYGALEAIVRLEEIKDPPKWYEIFGVILLGVLQMVVGLIAKYFIPVVGGVIGEFLLSTGFDDIMFGVNCAISGQFSWTAYWEQKKCSMRMACITAVAMGLVKGVAQFAKAGTAGQFVKAQKTLTYAESLRLAATSRGVAFSVSFRTDSANQLSVIFRMGRMVK
jgi:hypothetical protein